MTFTMDRASSERWVTISAAIVAVVYGYRRLTGVTSSPSAGTAAKRIIGLGDPVPLGTFATAWGFVFLVVSIMASASPGLGGSFAILIATGDLLTNAPAITGGVTKATSPTVGQALSSIGTTVGTAGAQGGQTSATPGSSTLPQTPAGQTAGARGRP